MRNIPTRQDSQIPLCHVGVACAHRAEDAEEEEHEEEAAEGVGEEDGGGGNGWGGGGEGGGELFCYEGYGV